MSKDLNRVKMDKAKYSLLVAICFDLETSVSKSATRKVLGLVKSWQRSTGSERQPWATCGGTSQRR